MMWNRNKIRGMFYTVVAGLCWGLSGVTGKYLIDVKEILVQQLVMIRLVGGGILLLAYVMKNKGTSLFNLWSKRRDVMDLAVFGIFGLAACQMTYFLSIQYSNPAVATILQRISPVIIMILYIVAQKRLPKKIEIKVFFLVIIGVILVATHGDVTNLILTKEALFWGLLSALFLSVYSVQPHRLLAKYDVLEIVGWGMLFGGIVLTIMFYWTLPKRIVWDGYTIMLVLGMIIYGTVVPFSACMKGVKLLGAVKASLYGCVEPLFSCVFSILILKSTFTEIDLVGMGCISVGVTVLTLAKK